MPNLCYGTGQGNSVKNLRFALENGYRHIDGADAYGDVAYRNAIRDIIKTVPRDELWITWKSDNISMNSIMQIIEDLDCGYINLFLIHHYDNNPHKSKGRLDILKEAVNFGFIRKYGVSNCDSIVTLRELKTEYDIYANQIQARPPGGQVAGRYAQLPPDFVDQCNAIGVRVMLFGTISGFSNAFINADDYSFIDFLPHVNKYYIERYIRGNPNVLMTTSSTPGSSSVLINKADIDAVGAPLLTAERFAEVENKLKEKTLSQQY
jgi:predicted oxidoreductase